MSQVLILSTPQDAHVIPVAEHLSKMNVPFNTLRSEEFASQYQLHHLIGAEKRKSTLDINGIAHDLHSYKSVWHRRPGNFPLFNFPEPWIGRIVEQETRESIYGILNSLDCIWVNRPMHDVNCMRKLLQLELAHQAGLEVPLTLITNKPGDAKEFFEACQGKVIYKLIGETSGLNLPPSEVSGIPTLPLRQADLQYLDQVKHAPHMFQQMIEKTHDVRVTVVGQKAFACRIYSQMGLGRIDWRSDYSVPMEEMQLPIEVEQNIFKLMKRLNLNYGAFDFCQLDDERYVFIEVNSAGQFIWMEDRTKQPISLELAKLLSGETPPLCS